MCAPSPAQYRAELALQVSRDLISLQWRSILKSSTNKNCIGSMYGLQSAYSLVFWLSHPVEPAGFPVAMFMQQKPNCAGLNYSKKSVLDSKLAWQVQATTSLWPHGLGTAVFAHARP
jgi:hypothetical protein